LLHGIVDMLKPSVGMIGYEVVYLRNTSDFKLSAVLRAKFPAMVCTYEFVHGLS